MQDEDFAAFRRSRLAAVAKPLALSAVGLCTAGAAKSIIHRSTSGIVMAVFAGVASCIPALVLHMGYQHLLTSAWVAYHLMYVALFVSVAFFVPSGPHLPIHSVLSNRHEMFVNLVMSPLNQVSIPIAAAMNAFSCLAQYLVYVKQLHGNPWQGAWRWLLNYAILMVVQFLYEARSRSLYNRQQKQRLLRAEAKVAGFQQKAASVSELSKPGKEVKELGSDAAAPGCSSTHAREAAEDHTARLLTHTASRVHDMYRALGSDCVSTAQFALSRVNRSRALPSTASTRHAGPSSCDEISAMPVLAVPSPAPAGHSQGRVASAQCRTVSGPTATATPISVSSQGGSSLVSRGAPAVHQQSAAPAAAALGSAAAAPAAATLGSAPRRTVPPPSQAQQAAALAALRQQMPRLMEVQPPAVEVDTSVRNGLQKMMRAPREHYIRLHNYEQQRVRMKLRGVEPEELPDKFTTTLMHQVTPCMPGVVLSGLAVRRGCVMVTLDLLSHISDQDEGPPLSHQCVRLFTDVINKCDMSEVMTRNLQLQITVPLGATEYMWDVSTQQFQQSLDSTTSSAVPQWLQQQAALCQMLGQLPAVVCATEEAARQVVLPLQLLLPTNSCLLGWQPPGSDTAVSCIQLSGTESVVALDVSVLVRHEGGAYLPVSLSLKSHTVRDLEVVEVECEVSVTLSDLKPGGLNLELWAKAHSTFSASSASPPSHTGPEVLFGHHSVLVLPTQHQSAAAELTQHSDSELLADLSSWLSHTSGHSSVQPGPALSEVLREIGTELLLHAVRNGWVAVVDMLGAAVRSSHSANAVWLSDAATGKDGNDMGGLLHAAMVSGHADILEKVLRWGLLHGGRQWQWPWSLANGQGYTALHLAAGHPEPAVCVSLLKTLVRMLPHAEVDTAHQCWLHAMGSVGFTPAACFAAIHSDVNTENLWQKSESAHKTVTPHAAEEAASSGSGSSSSSSGNSQAAATVTQHVEGAPPTDSNSSPVTATAPPIAPSTGNTSTTTRSLLSSDWYDTVSEAWRWRPSEQYQQWAEKQLTGIVMSWAWTMVVIAGASMLRSYLDTGLGAEWRYMAVHTASYLPIVATSFKFGSWQAWMPFLPVLQGVAYAYLSTMPTEQTPFWSQGARKGIDIVYNVFITATLEQNSLPCMTLTRLFLGYCHYRALQTGLIPRSARRAILVHTSAILVSMGLRAVQLRSYHKYKMALRAKKVD